MVSVRLNLDTSPRAWPPWGPARLVDLAGTNPSGPLRTLLSRAASAATPGAVVQHRADRQLTDGDRRRLGERRDGRDVCWQPHEAGPDTLVSIVVATRNRRRLLCERLLPSVLAQTHEHLEVVVVGDRCTDDTAQAVAAFGDPRIRFVDFSARAPSPPSRGRAHWHSMAHGPRNAALGLARGDWIAPCDDDDELSPHHVEVLLESVRQQRVELVHSRTAVRCSDELWVLLGEPEPRAGQVTHGSVLYSAALRGMTYSPTCWRARRPADWDLWRRMLRAGVRVGHCPQVTYAYYPSDVSAAAYSRRAGKELGRSLGR